MTEQRVDLITVDPDIVGGQARVRATRIPVSVILDCLAAGMTEDEIVAQYPSLTIDRIRAAALLGAYDLDGFSRCVVVVEPNRVRVRRPEDSEPR